MSEWANDRLMMINWLRTTLVRSTSSIKTIKFRSNRSWSDLLRASAENTVILWCQKSLDRLRTSSIQDKNRDLDQKSRIQCAMNQLIVERRCCDREDIKRKESFEHRNDRHCDTVASRVIEQLHCVVCFGEWEEIQSQIQYESMSLVLHRSMRMMKLSVSSTWITHDNIQIDSNLIVESRQSLMNLSLIVDLAYFESNLLSTFALHWISVAVFYSQVVICISALSQSIKFSYLRLNDLKESCRQH
jgi:hypothetical protein